MAAVVSMVSVLHLAAMLPILWGKGSVEDENDFIISSGIDCFECYSFNKSDRNCGDPFHPAYGKLKKYCTQGKEGRIGEFPAKYCIKLIGNTVNDDIEMVFRGCSVLSLDSQCGEFMFEDVRYRGCVMSCEDNGCNSGHRLTPSSLVLSLACIAAFISGCIAFTTRLKQLQF